MDGAPLMLLLAAGILLVWLLVARPNYRFEVRVSGGAARPVRGEVPPLLLRWVAAACARNRMRHGWVGGLPSGGKRVRLQFSRSMPARCQQQIRNEWTLLA